MHGVGMIGLGFGTNAFEEIKGINSHYGSTFDANETHLKQ
jgi:hypothetical protein